MQNNFFDSIFLQVKNFAENGGVVGWLFVGIIAIVMATLLKTIFSLAAKKLEPLATLTSSKWDDVGIKLIENTKRVFIFSWVFYLLSQPFIERSGVEKFFNIVVVVATVWQFALWGLIVIKHWRETALDVRIRTEPSSAAALGLLYTGVQVAFLMTLILLGLSNLGVNISALIAGLGVGGIAVALAAQNILGDLLASLSIVFDKPFVVGDSIDTGKKSGTVEHIGIKTTRLRATSGEQLILSNKAILESQIQNYQRMSVRRVQQNFGVVYSTPAGAIEAIPKWIKEIVERQPKLIFDRCHFVSYGESSLNFELVFFVSDPNYNLFMDLQQAVLIEILRKFKDEKIDFAFPTQTVHVEKDFLE